MPSSTPPNSPKKPTGSAGQIEKLRKETRYELAKVDEEIHGLSERLDKIEGQHTTLRRLVNDLVKKIQVLLRGKI